MRERSFGRLRDRQSKAAIARLFFTLIGTRSMAQLNDDLWRAILAFRREQGADWQQRLLDHWDQYREEQDERSILLRIVRDLFGPSWLYRLDQASLLAAERRIGIFDSLPAICATHFPSMKEPVILRRGEAGHWPVPRGLSMTGLNTLFGATPRDIAAMEVGSMFGWDAPGADPERYDTEGRLIRPLAERCSP